MSTRELRVELLRIESSLMEIRKTVTKDLEDIGLRIERASRALAPAAPQEMREKCEAIHWGEFLGRLGIRSRKALQKLSVTDGSRLAGITLDDLWELKNCGRTTVLEITNLLGEYGIELPWDVQ